MTTRSNSNTSRLLRSSGELAAELGCSPATIRRHAERINVGTWVAGRKVFDAGDCVLISESLDDGFDGDEPWLDSTDDECDDEPTFDDDADEDWDDDES